jgi:hypothetical protein
MKNISNKFLKSFFLAGAIYLQADCVTAQSIIALQDFENIPDILQATFVIEGGADFSGRSPMSACPASAPFYSQGQNAHGVINGMALLTSTKDIDAGAYSGVSVSLRVASFSVGNTAGGTDGSDMILIELSTDGGNSWSQELELNGNNNASWNYSSLVAGSSCDGDNAPAIFAPAGGGNRTSDGYSLLQITNIPGSRQLRLRITLLNNSNNELWLIDDLLIEGMPVAAITNNTIPEDSIPAAGIKIATREICLGPAYAQMKLETLPPFPFAESSYYSEDTNTPFHITERSKGFSVETLSPNPIAGQMKAEITVPEAGEVRVSLCDMRGNQLFDENFRAVAGTNIFEKYGLETIPAGLYVLRICVKDEAVFLKVIKE